MLLLVVVILISTEIKSMNLNNIAQAVKHAHRNFFAFNKTGPISLKQKCGIIKRAYFDLNGMKYPGTAKQWAIDKLHTKKRFWMAYSAATTLLLACASQQKYSPVYFLLETLAKTRKALINHHNYDGPNPFEQAEQAADAAAIL